MTTIVGGRWSGRRLTVPPGARTRPTAARVRAAIANALSATGGLLGASVLDLYAGSGALGLELASRGAAQVVLVERDRAAQATIRANLAMLGSAGITLVPTDAAAFARSPGEAFDIVLADPPYAEPGEALTRVLADLQRAGRLRPGADIVIERSVRDGQIDWPAPLESTRVRRYGDTLVCYGRGP